MPDLDYEPDFSARPVVVEHDGDVIRIRVLMQAPFAVPLGWVGIPSSPSLLRAIFEVTQHHLSMTQNRPEVPMSTITWPRSAIVEIRPNRFEQGLWIHAAGLVKDTYLSDLPPEIIDRLAAELHAALGLPPEPAPR